ncbi:MAG: TetR/AcrR family transcriptional regulator [Acidimicrobiales bacterium]
MASSSASRGDTKERLKSESLARFLEHGYRGVSVRDIADALGVTVPVLYYHFDSKDGLLAAIVEPFAHDGEALLTTLSAAPPLGRRRFVTRALAGYYDVLVAHLDVFRFVAADLTVRHHPVAGHRLAAQAARFLDLLADPEAGREGRLYAAAAMGAIRRPLRAADADPVADRPHVLAAAVAACCVHPPRSANGRNGRT